MADIATLQSQLAEARAAYHDIMVNGATRAVRHNGKDVEFAPADAARLKSYIADLVGQLAALGVTETGGRTRARRIAF